MSKEMRGHGAPYQRGSIWWIRYSIRGTVYRESSHSPDRNKAVKLLKRRLGDASNGSPIGPTAEKVTLGDMMDMLLREYRLKNRRSISTATHFTKNLLAYFGSTTRAMDISGSRIAAYVEARQGDGLSNASINRETACLRHSFFMMVEDKQLGKDHIPTITHLEEAPARRGFLEPAEFVKLRDALPTYLHGFADFAYFTGWRKSAVRSLMWSRDTALEFSEDGEAIVGGTVKLQVENSKNKKAYELQLEGELLEIIKRAWNNRVAECPLLFHKKGEPIGDFRKSWKKACTAAGLPGMLVHDFRRSAARNLVRAGVWERVAMDITGHSTRSMFDRYSISSTSDIKSAIEKVSAYVTGRAAEKPKVVPLQHKAA